jgi:hypothetical protein
MPLNSTSFTGELIAYIISLSFYLGAVYGGTVDKVAIFREDLTWTLPMSALLNYYLPLYGVTVVEEIAFPLTITPVDMASYWAQIDATGAQITIPLISGTAGILMMTQYAIMQPGCLVAGIDKLSQLETYWEDTNGACQYEIIPQSIYKTNKTSLTLPFWNSFIDMYDEEPFYTGAGAYDSINLLIEAVNETQSLNPDTIIVKLEDYDHATPFHGASGLIAFTPSHDLLEGWPYNYYLFCQWNSYGTKEVLPSWGFVYPDFIATGALKIPYWGINNLIGPQALPGAFTLSSDASVPDSDGSFNLTWSNSVGANSYSIYYSNQLNLRRLVKIADNAISPFKISNLMTDEYYFVIVAHNSVGEELSNSFYINVERPRPGDFILTSDAEIPDQDGEFNLTWTDSVGADDYSVYGHSGYITEINQSLTLMADQTGVSPYNISGLMDGTYYFAVEAHNDTGKTLSNCIEVVVLILPNDTGPVISIIAPVMNQQLEIPPAYEITVLDLNLDKIWYTFDNGTTKRFITLLIGVMDQTLWNQLPNGYINIRFYANDTFGNVNYDEVIVVKNTPAPPDGISGYDVVILLGIISVITAYLTKRKFAKKY